ncbi:hypothetical protein Slala05_70920 [Streptomyces lavendulae subsp. lavendulae]|nr:hypothetical protein Slala05_70920 [Streptomyces lavendulae subsp. lavendulae]
MTRPAGMAYALSATSAKCRLPRGSGVTVRRGARARFPPIVCSIGAGRAGSPGARVRPLPGPPPRGACGAGRPGVGYLGRPYIRCVCLLSWADNLSTSRFTAM